MKGPGDILDKELSIKFDLMSAVVSDKRKSHDDREGSIDGRCTMDAHAVVT